MPRVSVLFSTAPAETLALGQRLGEVLRPGDVLTLSGELGAGKTTLVAGLGRGWGALGPTSSPTFVIVNNYPRADGQHLWHLDCYRLTTPREALALGFDDLLDSGGAMVIEWPERIAPLLPAEHLHIALSWQGPQAREITLTPRGPRAEELMQFLVMGG
jgi:tRNA threonylcarbamoyladenosine biosynthesis protein TsaE